MGDLGYGGMMTVESNIASLQRDLARLTAENAGIKSLVDRLREDLMGLSSAVRVDATGVGELYRPDPQTPVFWFGKLLAWNSGTSDYSWDEVRRDAAGTDWETWSYGRSSGAMGRAKHVAGFEDVPVNAVVMMQQVPGDGSYRVVFTVVDSSAAWLSVTESDPTTVVVGEGYSRLGKDETQISAGAETISGFNSDGVWYACVRLNLDTEMWDLVQSTVVNVRPAATDPIRYWVLAKVTVAGSVISSIRQEWHGGSTIYENRVS